MTIHPEVVFVEKSMSYSPKSEPPGQSAFSREVILLRPHCTTPWIRYAGAVDPCIDGTPMMSHHRLTAKELEAARAAGRKAHESGRFDEAIRHQLRVVNHHVSQGTPDLDESKLLCLYLYSKGDYLSVERVLLNLVDQFPGDPENLENLGVVYRKMNRIEEAVGWLEKAVARAPERANCHDALAHCFGRLGEMGKCRQHGRTSLQLKDKQSLERGVRHPLPSGSPPPFSYQGNNIIAFSLWGSQPRYLRGAERNARLIPDLYPGWKARIYHDDSVPRETIELLDGLGVERVRMARPENFFDGLFWRFLPASDPGVDRFLVRDIDSVVNVKERVAVDQWLGSDRFFHVMRDYYSHTELILAGMWGGVGGILPPLDRLLAEFRPGTRATETFDQVFLRLAVWPTISQSVMVHDRLFDLPGTLSFPELGQLPPGQHIGQNEAAVVDAGRNQGEG